MINLPKVIRYSACGENQMHLFIQSGPYIYAYIVNDKGSTTQSILASETQDIPLT